MPHPVTATHEVPHQTRKQFTHSQSLHSRRSFTHCTRNVQQQPRINHWRECPTRPVTSRSPGLGDRRVRVVGGLTPMTHSLTDPLDPRPAPDRFTDRRDAPSHQLRSSLRGLSIHPLGSLSCRHALTLVPSSEILPPSRHIPRRFRSHYSLDPDWPSCSVAKKTNGVLDTRHRLSAYLAQCLPLHRSGSTGTDTCPERLSSGLPLALGREAGLFTSNDLLAPPGRSPDPRAPVAPPRLRHSPYDPVGDSRLGTANPSPTVASPTIARLVRSPAPLYLAWDGTHVPSDTLLPTAAPRSALAMVSCPAYTPSAPRQLAGCPRGGLDAHRTCTTR
jgi:hypothetical protein